LLLNGDFETDFTEGPTWISSFGSAPGETCEWVTDVPGITGFSGHYLHFQLTDAGIDEWKYSISAGNNGVGSTFILDFILESGKTYSLSFKACSSQTGRIHLSIGDYHEYVVNITPTTQLYTCQFVFNSTADSPATKFDIWVGNPPNTTMNNNVDFYIGDIQLLQQ
jgi:hypothetical protein